MTADEARNVQGMTCVHQEILYLHYRQNGSYFDAQSDNKTIALSAKLR